MKWPHQYFQAGPPAGCSALVQQPNIERVPKSGVSQSTWYRVLPHEECHLLLVLALAEPLRSPGRVKSAPLPQALLPVNQGFCIIWLLCSQVRSCAGGDCTLEMWVLFLWPWHTSAVFFKSYFQAKYASRVQAFLLRRYDSLNFHRVAHYNKSSQCRLLSFTLGHFPGMSRSMSSPFLWEENILSMNEHITATSGAKPPHYPTDTDTSTQPSTHATAVQKLHLLL